MRVKGFLSYFVLLVIHLVPGAGIEPARLSARDFESRASTYSAIPATRRLLCPISRNAATKHYKKINAGDRVAVFCISEMLRHTTEFSQDRYRRSRLVRE